MLTNADITLLIRRIDPATRSEVFDRRVIRGVSWHSRIDSVRVDGAILRQRTFAVRIPVNADTDGAGYAPPAQWPAQWPGLNGTWTVKAGDIVVRGVVDAPNSIKDLAQKHDEMMTVTAWADNRRGGLPHWRVEGK